MNQSIQLSDFPSTSWDKVRYADTDRQGHVNNAVFATYLETGRVNIIYGDNLNPEEAEISFVIASLQIDFRAEIHWPGKVEIGTGITKIGRTSLQLYQGIFQNGQLVAEAKTVIVQVSNTTKKSLPIEDQSRETLGAFMMES
ncbi:MAG: thioesterase family protein [Cytophagales bacterium]|nr:thioesterase family protein [Cytophagales bacterium]